ncbi:MAG: NACHT domain-containing protein [Cyanobacteria bacterium J06649_4]
MRATLWATLAVVALQILTSNDAGELAKQIARFAGVGLLVALLYEASDVFWAIWRARFGQVDEPLSLKERLIEEVRFRVRERLQYGVGQQDLIEVPVAPVPEQVGGVKRDDDDRRFRLLWNRELKVMQGDRTQTVEVGIGILDAWNHDSIQRKLLILGEPGSGKTTTLLKLAESLLEQSDGTGQFPYIFELSAWRDDRQDMLSWMVAELKVEHGIEPKESRGWIRNRQLVPLLDGLDELGIERQRKCVEKINDFVAVPGQSVVVCCRSEEYAEGQVRLKKLNGALCLQPLTDEQIEQYFRRLNRLDIWQAIQTRPDMKTLLQPYSDPKIEDFLKVKKAVQAFHETDLALQQSDVREQMLMNFPENLEKFEQLRDSIPGYGNENERVDLIQKLDSALDYLHEQQQGTPFLRTPLFLRMMVVSYQTSKSITNKSELLEAYVSSQLEKNNRQMVNRLSVIDADDEATMRYLKWLAYQLNKNFLYNNFLIESMQPSWLSNASDLLGYKVILFFSVSLLLGFIITSISLSLNFSARSLWAGPLAGFVIGFCYLFILDNSETESEIRSYDNFRFMGGNGVPQNMIAWMPLLRILITGFVISIFGGIIGYVLATFNIIAENPVSSGLKIALFICMYVISIASVILVQSIAFGTSRHSVKIPNQGMFNSVRSSLVTSAVFFPVIAFHFYFISYIYEGSDTDLSASILLGLLLSIIMAGGAFGGLSVLKHFSLRCILFARGHIPWNYAEFLKYTTECRLTQQIGGRFRFIHRELLDHFAKMDLGKSNA